jgi:hypothetical protein
VVEVTGEEPGRLETKKAPLVVGDGIDEDDDDWERFESIPCTWM